MPPGMPGGPPMPPTPSMPPPKPKAAAAPPPSAPKAAAVEPPSDPEAGSAMAAMASAVGGGADISGLTAYLGALEKKMDRILQNQSKLPAQLEQSHRGAQAQSQQASAGMAQGVAQAATQAAAAAAAQAVQQQQPAMVDAVNRAVATQIGAAVAPMQAALAKQMAASVEAAVARALEGSAERAAELVAAKLEAKLCERLDASVRPSVTAAVDQAVANLSSAANALPPAVSAQVASQVSATVSASFKEHFAGVLVPGFERASSGMFEQLHTAFSGGLKEFKSELSAPIMEAMQQSVAKATAAHEKLVARMVNDATAKVAGVAPPAKEGSRKSLSSQSAGGPPPPPPQASGSGRSVFDGPSAAAAAAPPPSQPAASGNGAANLMGNFAATMELQGLLSQGQNERAFALALGKNDPGILMWLCGKLEPKVLGGPPGVGLPMSQIIVMSLLQQLGADLQNETKLKIGWIKACLSVLNPADPQVAPNAGRVLSQLGERLTSAADALGDGPDSADLSLLMFKVKKLSS